MKRSDSRKKLLGAIYRQDRSAAQGRLAEATADLEQAEKALAEIVAGARRLEGEMRSHQVVGEVMAGRLEMTALNLEKNRARLGDIEASRRAVTEEVNAMKARVDAAKTAIAKAQRALDTLCRPPDGP